MIGRRHTNFFKKMEFSRYVYVIINAKIAISGFEKLIESNSASLKKFIHIIKKKIDDAEKSIQKIIIRKQPFFCQARKVLISILKSHATTVNNHKTKGRT